MDPHYPPRVGKPHFYKDKECGGWIVTWAVNSMQCNRTAGVDLIKSAWARFCKAVPFYGHGLLDSEHWDPKPI